MEMSNGLIGASKLTNRGRLAMQKFSTTCSAWARSTKWAHHLYLHKNCLPHQAENAGNSVDGNRQLRKQ